MLIDILADPYDMHDLAPTNRDVVDKMRRVPPFPRSARRARAPLPAPRQAGACPRSG